MSWYHSINLNYIVSYQEPIYTYVDGSNLVQLLSLPWDAVTTPTINPDFNNWATTAQSRKPEHDDNKSTSTGNTKNFKSRRCSLKKNCGF